jgi:ATP-dependent RNA helicase RhlB
LKKELPRNALIFTNMKYEADRVARHLEYNGYKCQHISGDLPQSKRLQIIDHFKAGKLPFLVATDVAARGLHVDDLELIINYDLPGDCENYVHRIGRTARAGKSGKAISLVCEKYVYNLEAIENFIGAKIPVGHPEEALFLEDKARDLAFSKPQRRARSGKGKAKGHPRKSSAGGRRRAAPTPEDKKPAAKKPSEAKAVKKSHKEPADRRHPGKKKSRSSQKVSTLEDRLAYYQKKYGDNFEVQKPAEAPVKKKTLLNKIAVFFKRKK